MLRMRLLMQHQPKVHELCINAPPVLLGYTITRHCSRYIDKLAMGCGFYIESIAGQGTISMMIVFIIAK